MNDAKAKVLAERRPPATRMRHTAISARWHRCARALLLIGANEKAFAAWGAKFGMADTQDEVDAAAVDGPDARYDSACEAYARATDATVAGVLEHVTGEAREVEASLMHAESPTYPETVRLAVAREVLAGRWEEAFAFSHRLKN